MRVNCPKYRGEGLQRKSLSERGNGGANVFFFFFSELPFTVGCRRRASDNAPNTAPEFRMEGGVDT